jgi:cell division protein FtsQ
VGTFAQIDARFQRPLAYADLRHVDGYALRLKGVGTQDAAALRTAAVARRHR